MFCAIISIILLSVTKSKQLLLFILILAFPEYGPDPYNTSFFSPFYFQKYVLLIAILSNFRLKCNFITIVFIILLILSFVTSYVYKIQGAVLNEIVLLFILGSLFFLKFDHKDKERITSFLLSFISFCFITSLIIDFYDVSSSRSNGGDVYFFGHWYGILVGYFILKILEVHYSLRVRFMLIASFFLSVMWNINSFQSSHFVWIFACLVIQLFFSSSLSLRRILFCIFFCAPLYFLYKVVLMYGIGTNDNSWALMKLLQVTSLFKFNIVEIGNSPLIRISEVVSLIQQSNFAQLFMGRGFASTYEMSGSLWALVNLHVSAFPDDQLESRSLQLVHETLVMLFKWSGILGILMFTLILLRRFNLEGFCRVHTYFCITLSYLFILSGVHTGILCLMLIKFKGILK